MKSFKTKKNKTWFYCGDLKGGRLVIPSNFDGINYDYEIDISDLDDFISDLLKKELISKLEQVDNLKSLLKEF